MAANAAPAVGAAAAPAVAFNNNEGEGRSVSDFIKNIKILVVDNDIESLSHLIPLLLECHYQVIACPTGFGALSMLRNNREEFDMVMSELELLDMDGLKFPGVIEAEFSLPVVIMSKEKTLDTDIQILRTSACLYLVKPVKKEHVSELWHHVVRKRLRLSTSSSIPYGNNKSVVMNDEKKFSSSSISSSIHSQNNEDNLSKKETISPKKPRMVWTDQLHDQFVSAVNTIGLEKAVPKKILELMNVPNLTRENIASHLQKYRINLRKDRRIRNDQQNHPSMIGSSSTPSSSVPHHHHHHHHPPILNQFHSTTPVVSQAQSDMANGEILNVHDGGFMNGAPFSYFTSVNETDGLNVGGSMNGGAPFCNCTSMNETDRLNVGGSMNGGGPYSSFLPMGYESLQHDSSNLVSYETVADNILNMVREGQILNETYNASQSLPTYGQTSNQNLGGEYLPETYHYPQ